MSYKLYNGSETITIKYFSMFSGIGGFEYGLQQSKYDFENVGFSEIDKYAVSIYERHYPNHTNYGDATKINTKNLQDFEFLIGGSITGLLNNTWVRFFWNPVLWCRC